MRKTLLIPLSLVLFAAACSGASDTSSAIDAGETTAAATLDQDEPTSIQAPAPSESAASPETAPRVEPAPENANQAEATPSQPAPQTLADGSNCGFGEDLEPDRVEISQIPGDGRDDSITSALANPDNDEFSTPLVDINRIISGGPPPDGIPPLDAPSFQTASSVNWLRCNEPVLSLSIDGEARAYPIQVMTWHELVNDTFDDLPITVSYCPLCNSALAYKRDLGDRVVTFGTSGRLFTSSLVMYDRETESLWTHFDGTAVVGELTGTKLELLPIQTTSWASFLEQHPDRLVLSKDTGFDRNYGTNPYSGYDDVNTNPFLLDVAADPRLPAKQRIVGIRRGEDNAAIVLDDLAEVGVLVTSVDDYELTVWHLPGTSTALDTRAIDEGRDIGAVGVFLPTVGDQTLTFSHTEDGSFTDAETGSTWSIHGIAIDGELQGEQLEQVEHLDTFWFALAAFEPDTRIITS